MKITIKKVALLVVALIAVGVVSVQALTKKELQGREQAIKEFLVNKGAALTIDDEKAYVNLVNKLKGTMLAHKVPHYLGLFNVQMLAKNLNTLKAGSVLTAQDIDNLKEEVKQLGQNHADMKKNYEDASYHAMWLAGLLLDAMRTGANFTQASSNKYRDALNELFEKEEWIVPNENTDLDQAGTFNTGVIGQAFVHK